MSELVFLKLGGSLITDKTRPYTLRAQTLQRLAEEIARVRRERPSLQILLGHGSGSFGHTAARQYHTRDGLHADEDPQAYWQGFAAVWQQAATLNRHVIGALHQAGLPAIAFPPSASLLSAEGRVQQWDIAPIQSALQAGLLPVVYGDTVFDARRGGTILSTEELFIYLAEKLHPRRILLAGLEAGIWADYPARQQLIPVLTPQTYPRFIRAIGASHGTDVTGGMAAKAAEMLSLLSTQPDLKEIRIFSGETADTLQQALQGKPVGTCLRPD